MNSICSNWKIHLSKLENVFVMHTGCSVAVCASARVKTYSVWVGRTGQACVVPLPWRWYATHSSLTRAFQPPSFLKNNARQRFEFLGGKGRHFISSKQDTTPLTTTRYLEKMITTTEKSLKLRWYLIPFVPLKVSFLNLRVKDVFHYQICLLIALDIVQTRRTERVLSQFLQCPRFESTC